MAARAYNPGKMQEAIQFFCDRIRNGTLGRTKLAKLLYFLDFDHFERYGRPVTGATYVHWQKGPYPKQMRQVLLQLREQGLVVESKEQAGPYVQFAYHLAQGVAPSIKVFSQTELSTLIDVADKWEKQTAAEIVAATHGEAPWIATGDNEEIPYVYAYYRRKFEAASDDEEERVALLLATE
ncbi:MAG: Panacea domain-containing protein [Chloroflexota bacterium]|nr:Panacea domain-containing protein [Chloroflexota bacterium]